MNNNCQIYTDEVATVEITYGLYDEFEKGRPHYTIRLCEKAAKELWDKCASIVNNGLCHWSNKSIKKKEN